LIFFHLDGRFDVGDKVFLAKTLGRIYSGPHEPRDPGVVAEHLPYVIRDKRNNIYSYERETLCLQGDELGTQISPTLEGLLVNSSYFISASTVNESSRITVTTISDSCVVIVSPHPYENDQDEYTVVEMSGANGYIVTFDEQSCTERNYDFVRFYKNDRLLDFWGEDKFSGGDDGSDKNFPGTGGRPALTIPAGRFVVHFHSDESNTDWGYKITVTTCTDPSASIAVASCKLYEQLLTLALL